MADPQARLQKLSEDFKQLQTELQTAIISRQKLEAQREENKGVQNEFENLAEDETIYKLVGTVLVTQDKSEAESTVKGRLDFIGGEITRSETHIKEIQQKLEKIKAEIIEIQTSGQAAASQAKGKAVAT